MSERIDYPTARRGMPWSFDDLAHRSAEALAIMNRRGIRVHRDSALRKTLDKAAQLSSVMGDVGAATSKKVSMLIDAGYADRVSEAIIATREDGDHATHHCLERMAKGLAPGDSRNPSKGKDAMWELDLLARLRRYRVPARLDEPDIVCDFGFGDYAIACKRMYGERTLSAKVRDGAKHIERSCLPGLVAVDIHNLLPHYATVVGESDEKVESRVVAVLEGIHRRQQRGFQRYLFEGSATLFWPASTSKLTLSPPPHDSAPCHRYLFGP